MSSSSLEHGSKSKEHSSCESTSEYSDSEDIYQGAKEIIRSTPWPSFEDMLKKGFIIRVFLQELGYDKTHHEFCKTLYENIWDEEIIKECGIKINDYGGLASMKTLDNLSSNVILNKYSPFKDSYCYETVGAPKMINIYWAGIGEWKCGI